jgi:hypothetical protein
MKKKIIIGVSAFAIVAIGAIIYFYLAFFSGTDLSKYVPKNAFFVMKVDLMGMGKKMNLKKATESNAVGKEIMENMNTSQKEMFEQLMKNPLKSGLQLGSNPTLFAFNDSKTKEEPVMGFMFGVSDKKNFRDFIGKMAKDITVQEPDQNGFYSANLTDEKFVLYFNDKVGIMLLDIDNKNVNLKRTRDEILSLNKDNSILTNEDFNTVNKQTNDMMVYFNGIEFGKVIDANDQMKNSMKSIPYAMTLNFIEDAISMKMFGSKSKDAPTAIYNESGFTESELKNIDPKGGPLAYFTMNLNVKKVLSLLNDQASNNYDIANFFTQVENVARELNIPKENLLNVFDGKIGMSFSGMRAANYADSLFAYQPALPFVNGWAHLGNKEAAIKLLDLMVTGGILNYNDGIYAEKNDFGTPGAFMAIKDNDLFVSTQEENIKSKLTGGDWNALKEDYGKKDVLAKPVTIFADLNYSSYESMLKSNMNQNDLDALNKFKNILSSFKNLSLTGNSNEFEMVIQFSEKKTNSLERIIELLQEAYRLTS